MEVKENFEARLRTIVEGKGKNTRLFSLEKVKDIISRLSKDLESDAITTIDYNYRSRYEILKVGETECLIKKRTDGEEHYKYVAAFEEVYGAIKKAHKDIGHGGEKKTLFEVKKKWSNITMEYCNLFINFCVECHLKKESEATKRACEIN